MTDKEIYEYHGWREQCKHITSEMYELTEAIHDYESDKNCVTHNHLVEEMADVEFMLNQIKSSYAISGIDLKKWKSYKRKRESKRISEGYYDCQGKH